MVVCTTFRLSYLVLYYFWSVFRNKNALLSTDKGAFFLSDAFLVERDAHFVRDAGRTVL